MGKKKWEDVIISNTDNIPGKKIIKTLDIIKIKHDATNFQKHAVTCQKIEYQRTNDILRITTVRAKLRYLMSLNKV